MAVRATVLCENSVYGMGDAVAEHGWSVWLETPRWAFLFDTGRGQGLWPNAALFKIPLAAAHAILLSHHHNDHTGGLLQTVRAIQRETERAVPVYAHPDLFKDSFVEEDGALTFCGLPHTRGALETTGADFRLAAGWQEIAPGVCMTGEVPRQTPYEVGDPDLKHRDSSGAIVVDPIRDDQTVVIDTPNGLFVVLGCSHAGLINILHYIQEQTGATRFHTVMGGTHLGFAGEEQVAQTLATLHDFDIGRIGVSHCTGPKVAARMAREFGDRFFFSSVGTVAEV
ncbi:MAG: MBL fold metallo-hydrolase [Gemmatimonadota bacterium]|nr:MBL fold metallo-hydrolase [Gemmatimonadota bacterium]